MSESSQNARLHAFSDGVFAIALTLLIIDINIPPTTEINSTAEFWKVLQHMLPSIFAFVLSFIIILITWVNHHNGGRLIKGTSNSFNYANGLLLLTIVFLPFPTSLLGEFLFTDHAAPAVVLYNGVIVIQSLGWILVCGSAISNKLVKNEKSIEQLEANRKSGYYALVAYSILAILAFWFPLTIAIITTMSWIFWLIYGINLKEE